MKIIWGSDSDRHRRSRGKRSDPGKRGRSGSHGTRRNPFTAPDEAPSPRRRNQRDPLAPIGEELADAGRAEHAARRRRKPHPDAADKTASVRRTPVGLTHMMFLLVGLALGAILLMSMNHLYSTMGQQKQEEPELIPAVQALPPPPPAVAPKAIRHATEPTQAIKLMLSAAAKGDVATAYAQWDISPDDFATVRRGQEMTLGDVVAQAKGAPDSLKDQQLRVISNAGTEAKVGQFRRGLCVQVFSLRKQGPYWKLYNASAP